MITDIIQDIVDEEAIKINDKDIKNEKIRALLNEEGDEVDEIDDDYQLTGDDLDILSGHYTIGFCLVTKINNNKLLNHNVNIRIHKNCLEHKPDDIPMVLLFQYEGVLIHILKKGQSISRLGELKSKLNKYLPNELR